MTTKRVLIRPTPTGYQSAVVVSADNDELTIRWDGSKEVVSYEPHAKDLVVAVGSLTHRIYSEREDLLGFFRKQPEEIFYEALAAPGPSGKTIGDLSTILAPLGLDEKTIAVAWEKSFGALAKRSDVKFSGAKNPTPGATYRLAEKEIPSAKATSASKPVRMSLPNATVGLRYVLEAIRKKQNPVAPLIEDDHNSFAEKLLSEIVGGEKKQRLAISPQEFWDLVDLAHALSAAEWKQLTSLHTSRRDQLMLATLATKPGKLAENLLKTFSWAPTKTAAHLLVQLRKDLSSRKSNEPSLGSNRTAFLEVIIYLAGHNHLAILDFQEVFRATQLIQGVKASHTQKASDLLLRYLANELVAGGPEIASQIEPKEIAAVLEHLPLVENGPRVAIMVALSKANPAELENIYWWRGWGSWSDIEMLGNPSLLDVLRSEGLTNSVRKPAVDQFLKTISTRDFLARAISGHRILAELIEPASFASVALKAAKNDPLLSGWLDAVSRKDEFESLKKTSEALNLTLATKEAELSQAKADSKTRGVAMAQLERKISAMKSESSEMLTSERRQLVIDAKRALAEVAASLEKVSLGGDNAPVLSKIRAQIARHGVSCFAENGRTVDFDPLLHNSPGGDPVSGSKVDVGRGGYKWDEENIVLVKALVSESLG